MSAHKSTGMKDLNKLPGRMSCTYAEAVVLLHNLSVAKESTSLPTPLVQASVVAAIYGREVVTVFDDIKRGMVP